MRIEQSSIQKAKVGFHAVQGFCIFIGGCLSVAVLTQPGGSSGTTGFFLGLVSFLSIPALIYQVMVPMWTRAWRFASVYAYAAVDVVFTVLWAIAFIAVAAWNSSGVRKGDHDTNDNPTENGSCTHYAYGSTSKCFTSKASVGFGILTCLAFAITSTISIQMVMKYRQTGVIPTMATKLEGGAEPFRSEDPNKDPWSANTDELDPNHELHEDPFDERRAYGQIPRNGSEQGVSLLDNDRQGHTNTSHDEAGSLHEPHPGRPFTYGSDSTLAVAPPAYDANLTPSALSPGGYEHSPGGRPDLHMSSYGEGFR